MEDPRIAKLRLLAERGATEGERNAARKALERIGSREVKEIPQAEWDYIEGSFGDAMNKLNQSMKLLVQAILASSTSMIAFHKAMENLDKHVNTEDFDTEDKEDDEDYLDPYIDLYYGEYPNEEEF